LQRLGDEIDLVAHQHVVDVGEHGRELVDLVDDAGDLRGQHGVDVLKSSCSDGSAAPGEVCSAAMPRSRSVCAFTPASMCWMRVGSGRSAPSNATCHECDGCGYAPGWK